MRKIYKHFKGEYYLEIGESTYSPDKCTGYLDTIYCVHTHLNQYVEIHKDNEGNMYHNFSKNSLVVYKSLFDATDIFVRPSYDFHIELDKDKYPNAKQKYRFERIGDKHE